jgi:biotin-dependent carboxylase-like uncharacterized protein
VNCKLSVLSPGFLTTVQDLGRVGYERLGVTGGGAMDRVALMAANALVANPPGAAGLECALQGPALEPDEDCLVAAAGRGFELEVGGRRLPAWMAAWVRRGEVVALRASGDGGWGYLAVSGGIDVPPVMGSRSTYLRGGFGGLEGRALQEGDVLAVWEESGTRMNTENTDHYLNSRVSPRSSVSILSVSPYHLYERAGLALAQERRPEYSEAPLVEVVLGPQAEAFTEAGLAAFLGGEYALTPACDRMGFRLAGPPIGHRQGADILSEGIPLGAVQVPGDGQPIVLMADRQTTGGYAKIGVVTSASLPLLVQCPPGGRVRFRAVSVGEAQEKWRGMRRAILSPG